MRIQLSMIGQSRTQRPRRPVWFFPAFHSWTPRGTRCSRRRGDDRGLVVPMHQYGQPVAKYKLRIADVWNWDVYACDRKWPFVGGSRLRQCHG